MTIGGLEKFNIKYYDHYSILFGSEEKRDIACHPNYQNREGNTVLHQYVVQQHIPLEMDYHEELQSLIDKGTNLELRNDSGKTAFLVAVLFRQKTTIETSIANGANVHVQDNVGNNALHYMVLPELIHHWETEGDNQVFIRPEAERLKFEDTISILERLLTEGVDVNTMNENHETPLMWASRGNHLSIIKILLRFGANVHLRDENMQTCLLLASKYIPDDPLNVKRWNENNNLIVPELARNEACVNCFDMAGKSALRYIFYSGHRNGLQCLRELVKAASLANWRKRMDFYFSMDQEHSRYFAVENRANLCYRDIDRMKTFDLPSGSNLCQFARRGVSKHEQRSAPEINDRVLEILAQESFPEYQDYLLSHFPHSYLSQKVSGMVIFARGEEHDVRLNYDIVVKLSSLLDKSDIINLISIYRSAPPFRRRGLKRKLS